MASLCENCANVNAGKDGERCSWAGRLIPVPGWTAIESCDKDTGKFYTWQVIRCPNYVEGIYKPVMDYDGCMRLIEAVLKSIRKCYPFEDEQQRKLDREFVRTFINDSEGAIDYLKRLAREEALARRKRMEP